MTRNQIEYQNYLELVRSNREKEALQRQANIEAARANAARESEMNRSNLATESNARKAMDVNNLISLRQAETAVTNSMISADSARNVAHINSEASKSVAQTNKLASDKRNEMNYLIAGLNNATITANAIMADRTERYKADKAYGSSIIGTGVTAFSRILGALAPR